VKPTLFSLFSGIGGIDLAFERAGYQIIGQVENDEFCTKVLFKHWPYVPKWRDIRDVQGTEVEARLRLHYETSAIDVMAGGFPCQDISSAGRGEGIKRGNRSGLWFEFARLIGELRPRVVLLENVPAITTRGGTIVIADLAALGYGAEWGIISASDCGAPHRRERWFAVAYASGQRLRSTDGGARDVLSNQNGNRPAPECGRDIIEPWSISPGVMADGHGQRREEWGKETAVITECGAELVGYSDSARYEIQRCPQPTGHSIVSSEPGQIEPRLGRVFNGLSIRVDAGMKWPAGPDEPQYDWELPRTVTGTMPNRAKRIKALGNAVVPQVVELVAERIKEVFFMEAERKE
jgi:DNA (cytosine-5)-methyltransferase 1